MAKNVKKPCEPSRGKEVVVDTQSSSAELSSIIMEATRSHTPRANQNINGGIEMQNNPLDEDELLLIHRQIDELQQQRVPSRAKMAQSAK
jgi:hypothetical protein